MDSKQDVSRQGQAINRISGERLLTADVGGTHARVGLIVAQSVAARPLSVAVYRDYLCADWASLEAILQDFIGSLEASLRPAAAVIASAGYVLGDTVVNGSLCWPLSIGALRRALDLEQLALINDWAAVAYAIGAVTVCESTPLMVPAAATPMRGPRVVTGPGTGLGTAVLLPGPPPQVLATEAGQIALAARNAREIAILRRLLAASDSGHVAYERVLSGPGLLALYRHLCALDGAPDRLLTPAEVSAAADSDPQASEALALFCAWLGSFCGDLAVLYGASGGLYLAGGILPALRSTLKTSAFRRRFLDKGVMRSFLERVPVVLLEHGQLGILGAAAWHLQQSAGA